MKGAKREQMPLPLRLNGSYTMKTRVTEQGILSPKELLEGADEVEIIKQDGMLIIVPAPAKDPIFEFGKHPIKAGVADASEKLDDYLYDSL